LWESQLVFTTAVDIGDGKVDVLLESSVLSKKLSGNKNKRQNKRIRAIARKPRPTSTEAAQTIFRKFDFNCIK
jgi:hypothetical protein